ncbi:MAG TPA: EamA family transporter [Spirochaetales bacterium]|nr:EamA family transporter [Spirochaetales bacterium]
MSRAAGVGLALVSATSFATLGLLAKFVYAEGFSVPQALAWRFTIAASALWLWLLARGGWKRSARDYRSALLLGALGFSPQAGLYFLTVRHLDPGLASLLLYLYPAFVVGLSALVFGERPRSRQLAALILALAGCVLTLGARGSYPVIGYVFGVAVAASYAAYLVAGERVLARLDPVFATTCVMTAAALVYWVVTLIDGSTRLPSGPGSVFGLLGLAMLATVLPIVTLFAAIKAIGASDASLVSTVEPLVTIALSAVFLGERLSAVQLAGGAFILAGVLALNLPERRRPGPGPA